MNNDFEKVEQLEEVNSSEIGESRQNPSSTNGAAADAIKTKKSIPVAVIIVSMISLAIIIGVFLIVGEMVAKNKGYSDSNVVDNEKDEDIVLDHTIFINGYKFELGVNLDEFLNGTQAIIDDKALEKAKKDGALYGEIEAFITKDDSNTKFKIYVDTTDEENVTIQSIIVESDRAFVEANQELNKDSNLVTIEFNVLGKYDIDKTLFSDLDEELQKLAKKTKIEDRDAYELVLKDSTGYEIKITFVSNDSAEEKYYIYNAVMMNVRTVS